MGLSVGEKRVRVDFNASNSGLVADIKNTCAGLINTLEAQKTLTENVGDSEAQRLIAAAQTKIEGACMWAVKAVTK